MDERFLTWMLNCGYLCRRNCFIHRRIEQPLSITHDQTKLMTLADRIVIMSATRIASGTGTIGRIEQIGAHKRSLQKTQLINAGLYRKPSDDVTLER